MMGWYFYKRIPLLKGVWLNLSKSGVTLSGKAGPLTMNVGKKGVAGNANIGGGLRYRTWNRWRKKDEASQSWFIGEKAIQAKYDNLTMQIILLVVVGMLLASLIIGVMP